MTKEEKNLKAIENLNKAIENTKNKNYTIFFFTMDSKNVPNSKATYTYFFAKTLQDLGYKVCMLYQVDNEYTKEELEKLENDPNAYIDDKRRFVGVGDWLGEQYANLPHANMQIEGSFKVGPEDILFIPEVFSSIMYLTYKNHLPWKRFVLLTNYDYVTEFIPMGYQWADYGIQDVVATTQYQADMINDVFSYTRNHTFILPPYIPDMFRKPIKPQKLIVNIISKNPDDVNKVIKTFQWRYPSHKFVTFRDVRGLAMNRFAETLKEGAITIWLDEETQFGYNALEAMRCGNILIAKLPNVLQPWMIDENGNLLDNAIWFSNTYDAPDALYKVISAWMRDEIPEQIYKAMEKTNKLYTYDEWERNITKMMEEIQEERIKDFTILKNYGENELKKEETHE